MIIATVVGTVIAGAWYGKFFAASWEKHTGVTSKALSDAYGKNYAMLLGTNFASSIGIAMMIAFVVAYFKDTSLWHYLATGFGLWLTLSVTTLVQHNLFEMKPHLLTGINALYQLVLYLAIALVIGLVS